MKSYDELIDELIELSFAEDIGDGDHTTLCCIPADEMGKSQLIIKEEGILAGVEVALKVFKKFDPELKTTVYINITAICPKRRRATRRPPPAHLPSPCSICSARTENLKKKPRKKRLKAVKSPKTRRNSSTIMPWI